MTNAIAGVLAVSPLALNVPDVDSGLGLMHTFFALEDLYGIKVQEVDDEIHLCLEKNKPTTNEFIFKMLSSWVEQDEKYRNGEITKDQYDKWRYNYPKNDELQGFVKVP